MCSIAGRSSGKDPLAKCALPVYRKADADRRRRPRPFCAYLFFFYSITWGEGDGSNIVKMSWGKQHRSVFFGKTGIENVVAIINLPPSFLCLFNFSQKLSDVLLPEERTNKSFTIVYESKLFFYYLYIFHQHRQNKMRKLNRTFFSISSLCGFFFEKRRKIRLLNDCFLCFLFKLDGLRNSPQ